MNLDALAKAQEWAWSHPYTIACCFGALGSVVNWAGKPRTAQEYAAMTPRRAAFFKLMSAVFPDVVKMLDGLRHLAQNTRPEDAPNVVVIGQATLEQTAATLVTKAIEVQQKRAEIKQAQDAAAKEAS